MHQSLSSGKQSTAASARRYAASYLKPELSDVEFAKKIRKPEGFFRQTLAGVKQDLKQQKEVRGDAELAELLTASQRRMYQESILISATSSASIIPYFMRANLGLPLIGNSIFAHMHAGLSQYVMDKHAIGTLTDSLSICTYYRTAVSVEDLNVHFGYSLDEVYQIVAKSFFSQYWAGDPAIFNPMTRSFYPLNSHFTAGATDLGREIEFQGAKLYAYGCEGKTAPVTILNNGDTAVFTDGSMSMVQHMIEARERGYDFPLIIQISANNSAISQRVATSEKEAVDRILMRLQNIGITQGEVTDAEDVVGGIKSMRSAVDQVRAGNGPRYVLTKYPFRPMGHASDASPASDDLILQQFDAFKSTLVRQLSMACDPTPTAGSQLADKISEMEDKMDAATQHALSGVSVHRRPAIKEMSAPGSALLAQDAGEEISLDVTYVLSKGVKEFAGLGADIYGKTVNATMDEMRAQNRIIRYVHQENHAVNKTDTRGGVYGELNQLSEKNLDENFVNFMPNETQVAQAGAGLRAVLPSDSVIICKGPHTLFNEHVKDFVKYAAFRKCDAGDTANTIYLMDGGSLAEDEKMMVDTPEGKVQREMTLARVGEHHNTPLYSGYAFDPNVMLAVPMDVNFFAAMMPEMIKLYEQGRQIIGFVPTNQFGALHPALDVVKEGRTLGPNDIMRIDYKHSRSKGTVKPLNGNQLVVVSWGPDSRWVCKYLAAKKLECTQFIVNYIHPPNALIRYLKTQVVARIPTEVVIVDPNPHAALLGPIMTSIKRELAYPDTLYFSECTIEPSYVPWGNGESLLNVGDLEASLALRGVIDTPSFARSLPKTAAKPVEPVAQASSVSEVFVVAPMDSDAVQVRFVVQPGTRVAADDVIAEVESDKATIEVVAPCDGVVEQFFVEEGIDMNITQETKIAKMSAQVVEERVVQPNAKAAITVSSPVEADSAIVTFRKARGDTVAPDEVVAELESDKATVEVTAPCAGVVDRIMCKENEEIRIAEGDAIFTMIATVESMNAPSIFAATSSISDPFEPQSIPLSKHQRQMVDNMTVRVGDTHSYSVSEIMDFSAVMAAAKSKNVSPSTLLLKQMADAVATLGLNKKLSADRMEFTLPKSIDLGLAIEVDGQLRVAAIRDVPNKSLDEIGEEIQSMVARGKYLAVKDQDLSTVCYTLSSLGKTATSQVLPTLIRGTTAILGVGRQDADGRAFMHLTCCHATITGSEGATLLRKMCEPLKE